MGERLKESTWFEIFRVGTWNGMEYTKEDLDQMVQNFEKGDPKVPLIIGHNGFWSGEEKPAHGWVEKLKRSGNRLLAKARNVSAELVEAVNEEIYPMRSIELWHNYNERGKALGAIAFLGGSNPAVGGMADFQFSKGAGDCPIYAREKEGRVCFSYGSTDKFHEEQSLPGKTHHQRGGDSNMDEKELAKLMADAVAQGIEQFKAGPEFAGLVETNQKLADELKETQNHAAAEAVRADLIGCQAFAKELLDNKKVTPAQFNGGLDAFLVSLDNTEKVEFSNGKPQTRREFAMELLRQAPGQKSLFNKVDEDTSRAGEDDNVSADVQSLAAKHGLDPKIVAQNFTAARKGLFSTVADEEGNLVNTAAPISIGATKAVK